jgi:hypothetical protein
VTLALLVAAFGVSAVLCRPVLRGNRLQARVGAVAALHFVVAAPVLAALVVWTDTSLIGCVLFWVGAGLAWFVVCSHLESSVVLAMLEDLESGPVDRNQLLRLYDARYGFDARVRELERARLIRDLGSPSVTLKGRCVLAFFGWLGGPTHDGARRAAPRSAPAAQAAAGRRG